MKKIYLDVRTSEFPIQAIHDKLLEVLRGGVADVQITGFPFALRLDLALPLEKAQSPLTRTLINKIELRGGKVWAAY